MPWEAPPASDRALAALAAIRTSVPTELPGSVRKTGRWHRSGTTAEAMAAYQAPGAPVPTGSTVAAVADGVLTVTCLGRQSGIFFRAEPDGCSYVIVPGPSLTVSGSGTPLDGTHCVRVGPFAGGFFASATVAGALWCAVATVGDDDDGKPNTTGAIGPVGALHSDDDDGGATPAGALKGAADLSRSADGAVTAVVHGAAATATITAYLTDSVELATSVLQAQASLPSPPR